MIDYEVAFDVRIIVYDLGQEHLEEVVREIQKIADDYAHKTVTNPSDVFETGLDMDSEKAGLITEDDCHYAEIPAKMLTILRLGDDEREADAKDLALRMFHEIYDRISKEIKVDNQSLDIDYFFDETCTQDLGFVGGGSEPYDVYYDKMLENEERGA